MTIVHYRICPTHCGDYAVQRYIHSGQHSRGRVLATRTHLSEARTLIAEHAVRDARAILDRQETAGQN